ncbi:red chlorophyll catabolite reductase [Phalaenopsis equestris]|uniref:red chlorophyll catabolite reductase n=1 Tax=Phalaenopsis equestris TaxID=78828 RepID=UPI0009E5592A|nr:red chlorophyll catabolite reductase [Phalaenopsis equestris]
MLALTSHSFALLSPLVPSTSHRSPSPIPTSTRTSSARASMERSRPHFPFLPPAHRALMFNLLATVDDRLDSALLPCAVPPDVLSFQNPQGSAHGSVHIRSGSQSSPVDFVLQSWLHCKTPSGSEINIATLFAFLNSSTDAPHFLFELIQGSPTSLVLLIDLLPRKDLVLHPDYLDEFYQSTNLDGPRRELEQLPQISPYRSSSLFIRSVLSPTAIAITVDCGKEGPANAIEDIIAGQICSAAEKIVGIWLEKCAGAGERVVGDGEKEGLEGRDVLIKRNAVEIDLAANLPRMFVPDVAERVVGELRKAFGV